MTRRIRFTPFVFAGAFAAALASPHRASAVQLPFVAQPAVPAGAHVLDLAQADIDRDGDVDLVSASRFPSPSGDGAEANALVENLRVYRDANGSGTFEPGTDVLVTEVPSLFLAAGVQTVLLADGDANVEVVFGVPRTYFVVVHLTGNASTQSPNTFRATLLGLGPSASRAEDRTYDIPLVPACPRDVSSAFMSTPVTLNGFTVE